MQQSEAAGISAAGSSRDRHPEEWWVQMPKPAGTFQCGEVEGLRSFHVYLTGLPC